MAGRDASRLRRGVPPRLPILIKRKLGARRRSYWFRLSAPSGSTHNHDKNEDGLQCPGSLAARVEKGGGCEMSDKIYDVPAEWSKRAWVDEAKYKEMYASSVSDPNGFSGE